MINRTQAIALRIAPFSRTSHLVTWLSPEYGKLVTPIRGACRPKSPFAGQYDLFYTCELLFYARSRNGSHVPKACAPLSLRRALRSNWKAAACASHLAALANTISQPHHREEALYQTLSRALDRLASKTPAPRLTMVSAELGFLDAAGLTPNLQPCRRCAPAHAPKRFCLLSGHWICEHRPPPSPNAPSLAIPPAAIKALRSPRTNFMLPSSCSGALPFLIRFLGLFLRVQLENPLRSRKLALRVMRSPCKQPEATDP